MSIYVKDSFDMPHAIGVHAIVTRMDDIVIRDNMFGGKDAFIFADSSNNPTEVLPNVQMAIVDPVIRAKLGVSGHGGCYPDVDDILLMCERIGNTLNWYKITYESVSTENG